jgi:hypothetical protein
MTPRNVRSLVLSAVACVALAASPACRRSRGPDEPAVDRSDGTIPVLHAVRVPEGAIRVDGLLTEPAWRRTGSTRGFVDSGTGRPQPGSRVQASARIAWDAANLYVGVVVYDADPATPYARTAVDPHLWEGSSAVELMLQPGDLGDNREYYEVQVDTAGAHWDTRFDDYNHPITDGPAPGTRIFGHQEWAPALRNGVRVERDAGRYTLEIALPWADVASSRGVAVPPRPGDTWRVNLYSFRDGQRDALAWSPILGRGNFHRATRFGRVVFDAER